MDKPRPKRQNENPLFGQGNRSGVRPKIRKLEGSSCQPFAERSYFNNIVAENVTCTSNVQINNDSTTSHSSRNPNAENSGAASTVKKRNFRTSRKPPDQPSDVTIKDAQQLEDGCRVTVTGKIANLMHEGTAYVHGNDLRLHVFVFADHTGSVRLTVWMNSELDLKVGQFYTLSNIAVKIFKSRKYLSTTPDTTSVISPLNGRNVVPVQTNRTLHRGPIIAARVSVKYYCVCKSQLDSLSADVDKIKCEECKKSVRSDSIRCVRWSEVTVGTTEGNISCGLSDGFLNNLIAVDRYGWCDTDQLERELTDISHVYVVMEDGDVVAVNLKGFERRECPY